MARVKKISGQQFAFDCIQKQFEIIGSDLRWKDFDEMCEWQKDHPRWYAEYEFPTEEKYIEWKNYFLEHFYDWQPKRVSKIEAMKEFSWFSLQYGLKFGFELEHVKHIYK